MDVLFSLITTLFTALFLTFITIVLILLGLYLLRRVWIRYSFETDSQKNAANLVYLSIKIPVDNEKKEDAFKSFLDTLHRALPNKAYISLEIVARQKRFSFYIAVHKNYRKLVESQLYAQYPGIEIELVQDYLSHIAHNVVTYESKFKKNSVLPLQTYETLTDNAFDTIHAYLARIDLEDQFVMQFALQRVDSHLINRGLSAIFFHLFGSKMSSTKLGHHLFKGKLRFSVASTSPHNAKQHLITVVSLLKQLKGANEITKGKLRQSDELLVKALKTRALIDRDLWSVDEIATIYHFPYKGGAVSGVVQTTSKKAAPPDILAKEGVVPASELSLIGETNFRNERIKFGIKRADRRRHVYIVGKTGVGKSKLLELMMRADVQYDCGLCLIDPHGDLAETVLRHIPKKRVRDVVYVDPADADFPVAFNPLEFTKDYQERQQIAFFFISLFKKIFSSDWNERMEHILRYIVLALLETPDSNVLGITRILSDISYRQRVIQQLQDPVVKSFWAHEFSSWNEQFATQAIVPIMNKVGQFIANPLVRNIVGQRTNKLNFEEFMNSGKIVIINVSKGKVGEENAKLLGSMFITKIQQAALTRASIEEQKRRDFYFYIDEFQNFATDAFNSILSESRKYRLSLTLAHQHIDQLDHDIQSTVFGNVATLISFSVSGTDAQFLAKEFEPVFEAQDLIGLEAREMYLKMPVDGKITKPFSARTITVPGAEFNYAQDIIEHSRQKYAENKVAVEREVEKWTQNIQVTTSNSSTEKGEFPEPIV